MTDAHLPLVAGGQGRTAREVYADGVHLGFLILVALGLTAAIVLLSR